MPFSDDETNPTDGYSIPSYPANARAYRAMNKARTAVEHSETEGRHTFGFGSTATRDAISTWEDGAIFFNSSVITDGFAQQIYVTALGGWQTIQPSINTPRLDEQNVFIVPQYGDAAAVVPSGGNVTIDCDDTPFKTIALNQNVTLLNPSSDVSGKMTSIDVLLTQDGTGGRTVSYGSNYRFPGNVQPLIASGPGDVTLLTLKKFTSSLWLVLAASDIG